MWKITRLYLKNSIQVWSGLNKEEIDIDFTTNDHVVNIFIGKMGSGKTSILAHAQPFATFGTLDIRNQEAVIEPEKDGKKIIEYTNGEHYYIIEHIYQWNARTSSHNVKSYIKKDGEELNPNGNSGTFKETIHTEFGIEQNFLRILRLGPNVANLINMKSTERKNFVVSLRHDTEVYTLIYKKLNDELRTKNTSLSLLSNKLMQLSADNVENMENEVLAKKEKHREIEHELEEAKIKRTEINVAIDQLLERKSVDGYQSLIRQKRNELAEIDHERAKLQADLDEISDDLDLSKLSIQIGSLNERYRQLESDEFSDSNTIEQLEQTYRKLVDRKVIRGNRDHLNEMQATFDRLCQMLVDYEKKISGFSCKFSYSYISSTLETLKGLDQALDDLRSNPPRVLAQISTSKGNLGTFASKEIEKLRGRRFKLQQQMSNLQYSATYKVPPILFRGPMCPTTDCPYYQSHPATIQKKAKHDGGINTALAELKDKITSVDDRIAELEMIPLTAQKYYATRSLWNATLPVVKELGALLQSNMYAVITNLQYYQWYDYNQIIRVMEKCKALEEYDQLRHEMIGVETELTDLKKSVGEDIDTLIQQNRNEYDKVYSHLQETISNKAITAQELEHLNHQVQLYSSRQQILSEFNLTKSEFETLDAEIRQMELNLDNAGSYDAELVRVNHRIMMLDDQHRRVGSEIDNIETTLRDIAYTKEEYDRTSTKRALLKDVLKAVSPKEGIPLIMVKLFLDSCRDTINDLISDIFVDTLEIQDFDLDEDNFYIPYTINGRWIKDIESASQGQQAIISIALSFAMIRQDIFDYNIMLLDEVDGALHPRDREKFTSILFRQIQEIGAKQVFLISHNNSFENVPANIIMTTEEPIDSLKMHHVIRLYE